jgi:hypothetical protein
MAKSLKRRVSVRQQRSKIFLFTEGKNTEPEYFKAYEKYAAHSRVELQYQRENGAPKTLFEPAFQMHTLLQRRSYQRDNGKTDQVWIVFDKDDHDDVWRVLNDCAQLGINTAFSNPCFEVWLILHKEPYDRDEHRRLTQERCEAVCRGYDKSSRKLPSLAELMPLVKNAELRAIELENRREQDGGQAPLTTVYRLTRIIRGESEL